MENLLDSNINLYYLNNTIKEFELPSSLNEFRTRIKKMFHIENKTYEEIFILYNIDEEENDSEENQKEATVEVKTDDDYTLLLNRNEKKKIKDNIIMVETDKFQGAISRKSPESFEEEIRCVIQNELKAAGERIKKYLSGKQKCYPSSKTKDEKTCSKCNKTIIGKSFRDVIIENEEKYYCEKCSLLHDKPVFIIN